ncbi:MAG: restriction endonuclease [Ignavibacteria bacterium]|nr:restriction endonuclease [Ignavibacteria bacterium]
MIPDFQSLMLPILKYLGDGKEYSSKDILQKVTSDFDLTPEEISELLPSGTTRVVVNRIGWALSHLKQSDLIESTKRSYYKLTDSGRSVLQQDLERIDLKFLRTLPSYLKWRSSFSNTNSETDTNQNNDVVEQDSRTPEELIESSYNKIKEDLVLEILDRIKKNSPQFFEFLVIDLLTKMGYGGSREEAGAVIGKSGDGGIDGIIKEDRLGLDSIYIQAKRWENTVPISNVRDFAGSLLSIKSKKGIFITTSNFPKGAYEYVNSIEHKIILIDGKELAELMIEHNVAVNIKSTFEIKRIDLDYFEE